MQTNKPIVVGIGELLWDVFPAGKRAGGAPINFVYHATQQGAAGYAISAVGNDNAGTEIIQELERNHIASDYISRVDRPTGLVLVDLINGIPTYDIIEDVAWDYIPLTDAAIELVKQADAICYGTLAQRSPESHATLNALLSHAPADALRFFDINLRQSYYTKELIEESLKKANVLKINDEELVILRKLFHLKGRANDICHTLIDRYHLRYLVLTAGADYSTVYAPGEESTILTPHVDVADTVGAGDSFSGAFVCAILQGASLREAHLKAVETAAFVCTQLGAWPAYPNA